MWSSSSSSIYTSDHLLHWRRTEEQEMTWKSEPVSTEGGCKPAGWRRRSIFLLVFVFFLCFFSLLCHVPKPHVARKPQPNDVHAILTTPPSLLPVKKDWLVFLGTAAVSFEASGKVERRVCFRIRGRPLFTWVWERLFAPEASRNKSFVLNFLKGTRSKSLYFFGKWWEEFWRRENKN